MAEFSFQKLTSKMVSKTMLDAARNPKMNEIVHPRTLVVEPSPEISVSKAKDLLSQARAKAPPPGWRHFFRAVRRQPRVNGLIFRVLAELIKLARRGNTQTQKLHEQVDFVRYQASVIQEQIRQFTQTSYEQQEELASISRAHLEFQNQQREVIADLKRTILDLQTGREVIAKFAQTLAEIQSQQDQIVVALKQAATEERLQAEIHAVSMLQQRKTEEHNIELLTLIEQVRERANTVAEQAASLQRSLRSDLDEIRARVLRADRSVQHLRTERRPISAKKSGTALKKNRPKDEAAESIAGEPFDYFMFEQRFRGDMAVIKLRQQGYIDLFRECKNVIDLGCGRGEFLELLTENGIPATGIDLNTEMIECCRARGLKVVQADLLNYLESLTDQSVSGIFSAQVVEHLSSKQIMHFITLCGMKLKPAGVAVVETVNANCLYALGNFYLDPTHTKPVPFGLLQFMFEQAGFEIKEVRFSGLVPGGAGDPVLRTSDGVPATCVNYQDYAVIAVRLP